MSEPRFQLESILVADCGSTTTKVVLFDLVDGQYRFVASAASFSTVSKPWDDVSVGVIDALQKLHKTTGRRFFDDKDQLITPELADGSGVDRFMAVSSAAEPLRVILAGLVRDASLASARRAALSTYTNIVDVLSLEQGSDHGRLRTIDDQINAIWHGTPDLLCIVGGTDGGAETPLLSMVQDVIRVALHLMGQAAPPVIYAGNAKLSDRVVKLLEKSVPIQAVPNVRPQSEIENIGPASEEIEVRFYDQKMAFLPGINVLNGWGPSLVLPTARAADYTTRFCERIWKSSRPALSVDVGSSTVSLNGCRDGQPLSLVRTDLGIGYGLAGLLEQVDMGDIIRWLPLEIGETEVRDRLMNKALRPHTIPQVREDLLLLQAAAREALRLALHDFLPGWAENRGAEGDTVPPCEPLIIGGSLFTRAPCHGHAALIALDALQPVGISALYLDEHNLMPSLGAVGVVEPLAMVQVLRNNGLTFLGTVVVPIGRARPGQTVLTIRPAGKTSSIRAEVKYGSLEAIPFQFFEPGAKLVLSPASGIDIGYGQGKSHTIEYRGGTVGLIVDARGRPIQFDRDGQARRQQVDRWLWEMMSS